MSEASMRRDRIERLLRELEYEVVRGVMEREIEPDMHMSKIIPYDGNASKLACIEFHVYPSDNGVGMSNNQKPKLRVVE